MAKKNRLRATVFASIRETAPRLPITTVCAGLLALAGHPSGAIAASAGQTVDFSIPPGSLSSALLQFSEKSGQKVLFNADLVRGRNSGAVQGRLSTDQALRQLLADSGLEYRRTSVGSVTIAQQTAAAPVKPAQQSKPSPAGEVTLPTITVTGKTGYDPADPYSKDYAVTSATTATKTDTPIMQTPLSIQVVPRSVMRDQQVVRLEDALKNVSGVSNDSSYGSANVYDSFMIRGFTINSGIYRNGLRLAEQSYETASLDRIEVLKGPASALYGRTEPGGMINMVSKRPMEERYYSLEQQFGSYDFYRTTLDATGPVTADRSVLYRVNLAYQDADSFRDYTQKERIYVAPSLLWRPTDQDEVFLNFEYRNDTFRSDGGIPPLVLPAAPHNGRPAPVPISFSVNDNIGRERLETYTVGSEITHRFNEDWKITNRYLFHQNNYNWNTLWQSGIIAGTNDVDRAFLIRGPGQTDYHAVNLDLTGQFDTFGVKHKVLLGFDYYNSKRYDGNNTWDYLPVAIPPINLYNPIHGSVAIPSNLGINAFWRNDSEWHGFYFQDQMTFFDKLHLMFGGRHDHADQASGFSATPNIALSRNTVDDFNPRVGLLYQPVSWLSVYGNYIESLGAPNSGMAYPGRVLDPERAQQYEAGLKAEFFDGRLSSSLAYFHLTKQNVSAPDPGHANFSVTIGEARSQGIEWDVSGRVTDDFSIIGSYAYMDTRITKDISGNQGHRLYNAPEHSASLWGKYDLTPNITLGTGIYVVGQREGDAANSYQLPGYARWDMMAAYHQPIGNSKLTLQLNANNVLDKRYYASSNSGTQITPGTPLFLMGSVKLEY